MPHASIYKLLKSLVKYNINYMQNYDFHRFNKLFRNLKNSIIWLISGKWRGQINFCIM